MSVKKFVVGCFDDENAVPAVKIHARQKDS
jgi:hypothetical protein